MAKKREGKRVDTGRKKANGAPIYNWIKEDKKTIDNDLTSSVSSDFDNTKTDTTSSIDYYSLIDYYSEEIPYIENELENIVTTLDNNTVLSKKDSKKLFDTITQEKNNNDDYYHASQEMSLDNDTKELIKDSHDRLKEELDNYNLVYLAMSDHNMKDNTELYEKIKEKLSNNSIISQNNNVDSVHTTYGKYVVSTRNEDISLSPKKMKELLLDKKLSSKDYYKTPNRDSNVTVVDDGFNRTVTTSRGHSYTLPSRRMRSTGRNYNSFQASEVVEDMKNWNVDSFREYLEVAFQKEAEYYAESFEFNMEDYSEEEKYYEALNYYNEKMFNIVSEELDNFDDIPTSAQWRKVRKRLNNIHKE